MFHDNLTLAHQGTEAMRQQINKRYVWKGMTSDIKEYVKSYYCHVRKVVTAPRGHVRLVLLLDQTNINLVCWQVSDLQQSSCFCRVQL